MPALTGRQTTLWRCLSDAEDERIHVSEKVKAFWRSKKAAIDEQLDVLLEAEESEDELDEEGKLKRETFLAKAIEAWQVSVSDILRKVNREMVGPYVLGECRLGTMDAISLGGTGDQLSVADLHLAAWMARLVTLAGGATADDGRTAVGRVEARMGGGFLLPKDHPVHGRKESKLAVFWDAMRERPSWKKIYRAGLF